MRSRCWLVLLLISFPSCQNQSCNSFTFLTSPTKYALFLLSTNDSHSRSFSSSANAFQISKCRPRLLRSHSRRKVRCTELTSECPRCSLPASSAIHCVNNLYLMFLLSFLFQRSLVIQRMLKIFFNSIISCQSGFCMSSRKWSFTASIESRVIWKHRAKTMTSLRLVLVTCFAHQDVGFIKVATEHFRRFATRRFDLDAHFCTLSGHFHGLVIQFDTDNSPEISRLETEMNDSLENDLLLLSMGHRWVCPVSQSPLRRSHRKWSDHENWRCTGGELAACRETRRDDGISLDFLSSRVRDAQWTCRTDDK